LQALLLRRRRRRRRLGHAAAHRFHELGATKKKSNPSPEQCAEPVK